jgi:hypothetical protein
VGDLGEAKALTHFEDAYGNRVTPADGLMYPYWEGSPIEHEVYDDDVIAFEVED